MKAANITLNNLHVWKQYVSSIRLSRKNRIILKGLDGETYVSSEKLEQKLSQEELFGHLLAFAEWEDVYYTTALELETLEIKRVHPEGDPTLRGILLDIVGAYGLGQDNVSLARGSLRNQLTLILSIELDTIETSAIRALNGRLNSLFQSDVSVN
jgi:hypothetical protein